ncbi:Hsp20/alpha crystallin family protein [Deinococcus arenicola]|uniref:Hsp20/alpha crystallin family protein n=1 Tax=Deinococcus arenicola TaxID=2994950 RepID=A0ABU4DQ28_9DEIO|nr:Hsp20/alpha crystallin family protein [Deinococcus sp. ZS9-10]MDV6374505.1 Hsp20/alpha crystallin family protein [Deinococcus sp. ZS9-10]
MNEPVLARLQHLMTLREEVETLSSGPWTPAADWADGDTHLTLYLDVPGIDPERLEMHEEDGTLTVAGERAAPEGLHSSPLLSTERPSGVFRRTLVFPREVLPQSGEAHLAGGVLTVRFQKKHPTIDV